MKLIVAASVPLLGAVVGLPFGAIISLVWPVSLHGPTFLASACGGSIPEKSRWVVLWSTGPAAQGNLESGFNFFSQAQVSREEELSILTCVEISIQKVNIKAVLDTGSPVNAVSSKLVKKLKLAPNLNYHQLYGTAGLSMTCNIGTYYVLSIWFGKLTLGRACCCLGG
ncbi:hypothetical protein DSO57_1023001 [Entomophthora muscae]|uniref:Uncharacterized protein n=1 Tax=Entomophthora muscae TaxID=34485 RepID=A0ACC2U1I0_9FUNG|nr:hypothetical protein DSO57_1023001 [Entomophthora muscae]